MTEFNHHDFNIQRMTHIRVENIRGVQHEQSTTDRKNRY